MKTDSDLPAHIDLRDYNLAEVNGQIPFDFIRRPVVSPDEKPATAGFMKLLGASMDKAAKDFRAALEEQGERVFDILRHNDFRSVETDYGAPALGLSFFRDLPDPVRSFRYEPVVIVEEIPKTHVPQSIKIAKALIRQGYKIFDGLKEDQYPSQLHFTDGGVTRLFSDVVENIVTTYEDVEREKKKYGHAQRGAVLVPVPTYGLFLWRLEELLRGKNIDLIHLRRHDNGALDQKSLKIAIQECRLKNIRILAYYDSNPHNPTGYIRERAETEDIAYLLQEEDSRALEKNIEALCSVVEEGQKQGLKVKPAYWFANLERPQGQTVLIDDMAYEGLEYTKRKKPYSFGQVSTMVSQRAAVLKGISKIGLPGLRAGVVIAHPEIVTPLSEKQLMTEFAASSLGVDILTARFGDSEHKKSFNAHINSLRRHHTHKTGIVEAFFHGLDNTDKMTEAQKRKLVKNYATFSGLSLDDAKDRLSQGLAPFHLEGDVECGFFHRINCEAMAGAYIYMHLNTQKWPQLTALNYSSNLYWIFRSFGMKVVAGTQQGLSEGALQVRITTSLPEKEMLRFYNAMQEMRAYFFGNNPQIQKDLFRPDYTTPRPAP